MASDDGVPELIELRPAPAVLLRHRDADLDVHTAPRTGPRVELRRGALWIRAGEEGPGVTVTHGATSVQVRAGAGVVEVLDMEALLVVASGRAAVKGVSPLPRSVIAGQAVTLTLDGTFSDPDALSAAELAADRMVVENLALDNLASGTSAADGPTRLPPRLPAALGETRVDPPGAPQVEGTGDPFAPRVRPEVEPEPEPAVAAVAPTPEVAEPLPVGRPAPSLPPVAEPSALESALAGVGVTDTPLEPGETRVPVAPATPSPAPEDPAPTRAKEPRAKKEKAPKAPKAKPPKAKPPKAKREKAAKPDQAAKMATEDAAPAVDDRRRQRILVALVLGALLILAIVAALAFNTDSASALGLSPAL